MKAMDKVSSSSGTVQSDDWDILKVITESEHHFNDLCFKIRTLASSWMLATFAGIGFLLTKSVNSEIAVTQIMVLLCWVSSIGILVLWVLDLLIYQRLLNSWFDAREPIEKRNKGKFPQMRERIKKTQPKGRASNLIKLFYLSVCAAPLLFAIYIASSSDMSYWVIYVTSALLVSVLITIFNLTPGEEVDLQSDFDSDVINLKNKYDYLASDTSEIFLLANGINAGLCQCILPVSGISKAISHKTVEEIWCFLEGEGEVYREGINGDKPVRVSAGTSLVIPVNSTFQFRNVGAEPLKFIIATVPRWPGEGEVVPKVGIWSLPSN